MSLRGCGTYYMATETDFFLSQQAKERSFLLFVAFVRWGRKKGSKRCTGTKKRGQAVGSPCRSEIIRLCWMEKEQFDCHMLAVTHATRAET